MPCRRTKEWERVAVCGCGSDRTALREDLRSGRKEVVVGKGGTGIGRGRRKGEEGEGGTRQRGGGSFEAEGERRGWQEVEMETLMVGGRQKGRGKGGEKRRKGIRWLAEAGEVEGCGRWNE